MKASKTTQLAQDTAAQMRRGTLEFCILLLIRKKGKMYVSDLLKELKSINLIVVDGTAYPLLNLLGRASGRERV